MAKWLFRIFGKTAGGWILGNLKSIAIGAMVVAASALIATVVIYIHGAEKAKGRNIALEERMQRTEQAARMNQESAEQCQAANAANAEMAADALERARVAELKLAAASVNADRDVADIKREATNFRARTLECPALNDDFRRWVLK